MISVSYWWGGCRGINSEAAFASTGSRLSDGLSSSCVLGAICGKYQLSFGFSINSYFSIALLTIYVYTKINNWENNHSDQGKFTQVLFFYD